ncbi:aminotransferase class I/II-fold pyridoxal phosphate-dependent enzyme [Mesorhizobium sp. M0317]|uniref:aminotransferase class I/II-fold pyridoxal phosphate-dependent enzyme n=1 Tax=Mesorhizobium sp. M0317 TaxID=2956935 RepID=UPI00333AD8EB
MSEQPNVSLNRFRNIAFVIDQTRSHFDHAYELGVMGIYGRSLQGRHVLLREKDGAQSRIVDFVRCSYLGLDNHPDIVSGAISAISDYGALHWSTARTRLNYGLLQELENQLSHLFRARVICFSNVMVTNMGALPIIASGHLTEGKKPVVVFDRECHASLQYHKAAIADETRVVTIRHNDVDALEDICKHEACVAYVADGVYSMGGEAPINALRDLQERYGLFLYIDDAHGISLFGANGEGFARAQFPDDLGDRTIIAASLAKGFGASGGIVMLGTAHQENLFRRFAQSYVFTAAPNLAAVGAGLASASLHASKELSMRQKALTERIRFFDTKVATPQQGNSLPIRMVPVGDELSTISQTKWLLDQGFYTSATFFPTVARGAASLRICLTASHSLEEIENICRLLEVASDRTKQAVA